MGRYADSETYLGVKITLQEYIDKIESTYSEEERDAMDFYPDLPNIEGYWLQECEDVFSDESNNLKVLCSYFYDGHMPTVFYLAEKLVETSISAYSEGRSVDSVDCNKMDDALRMLDSVFHGRDKKIISSIQIL